MVTVIFKMPHDVVALLAERFRQRRLSLNWTQQTLSERSGVSYGSLRKFERTGQIALVSLLKLALVLGVLPEFEGLLLQSPEEFVSLDHLLRDNESKKRKRGRE